MRQNSAETERRRSGRGMRTAANQEMAIRVWARRPAEPSRRFVINYATSTATTASPGRPQNPLSNPGGHVLLQNWSYRT